MQKALGQKWHLAESRAKRTQVWRFILYSRYFGTSEMETIPVLSEECVCFGAFLHWCAI